MVCRVFPSPLEQMSDGQIERKEFNLTVHLRGHRQDRCDV